MTGVGKSSHHTPSPVVLIIPQVHRGRKPLFLLFRMGFAFCLSRAIRMVKFVGYDHIFEKWNNIQNA